MFSKKLSDRPVPQKSVSSKPEPALFEDASASGNGPQFTLNPGADDAAAVPEAVSLSQAAHEKEAAAAPKTRQNLPSALPSFRPDIMKRGESGIASVPSLPRKPVEANISNAAASGDVRKLIVGRDIELAGEISACDYLVVEGTVEARVREGRRIEITETGLFKGAVEIDEADINGRFEGDIIVRGRLKVGATGNINGKIQYGELEVESGGQLQGQIEAIGASSKAASSTVPVLKSRTIELSEAGNMAASRKG